MHRFARYGAAISACLIVSDANMGNASSQVAADLDAIPELRLVEELRIGSATDPNAGFSRIGNIAVDQDGQVYVFEVQDVRIRVYSSSGRLVRTIGRRGSGPGEFEQGAKIGVTGDTVWAYESLGGTGTISLFKRQDGTLIATTVIEGVQVPGRGRSNLLLQPSEMRSDGNFVSGGYATAMMRNAPATGIGPADTLRVPRILFSARGAVVDTLAWRREPPAKVLPPVQYVTSVANNQRAVPRPFPDAEISAYFVDGRFAVQRPTPQSAAPATFRVIREGVRGDSIYNRTYRYRPAGYSSEVLDDIAASSLRSTGIAIVAGAVQQQVADTTASTRRAIRQAMSFPDFQPPVQNTFVGVDASIWLRREEAKSPTQRWDLLDPQGNPRGRVNLPVRLRPAWSNGDVLWGVLPDNDDVPWLVKFRISR